MVLDCCPSVSRIVPLTVVHKGNDFFIKKLDSELSLEFFNTLESLLTDRGRLIFWDRKYPMVAFNRD